MLDISIRKKQLINVRHLENSTRESTKRGKIKHEHYVHNPVKSMVKIMTLSMSETLSKMSSPYSSLMNF